MYLIIPRHEATPKKRNPTGKQQDQPSDSEISDDHILAHHENRFYNCVITLTLERIQPNFAAIGFFISAIWCVFWAAKMVR